MRSRVGTPEELESLLEHALSLGARQAIASLFDAEAVKTTASEAIEARDAFEIARIVQSGTTALVVAERALNVMHRRPAAAGATRSP